jgi:hypothetical protein
MSRSFTTEQWISAKYLGHVLPLVDGAGEIATWITHHQRRASAVACEGVQASQQQQRGRRYERAGESATSASCAPLSALGPSPEA